MAELLFYTFFSGLQYSQNILLDRFLCYAIMPSCSCIHLQSDLEWHSENIPFFRPFALTFNLYL